MTITELISELEKRRARHGDVEVKITWETTVHEIEPRHVYAIQEKDGIELRLDGDENSYKRPDWGVLPEEFEMCECGHSEAVHTYYCKGPDECDCEEFEAVEVPT